MALSVYKESDNTFNVQTGKKTVVKQKINIRRAVILPGLMHRDFAYGITFVKNNSNFVYGDTFDINERRFIIDNRDVPSTFVIKEEDYLVYNHERYDFKSVEMDIDNLGYFIVAKKLEGEMTYEILDGFYKDKLEFQEQQSLRKSNVLTNNLVFSEIFDPVTIHNSTLNQTLSFTEAFLEIKSPPIR